MDSKKKRQIERHLGQPWRGTADVIEFPTHAPKGALWGCRVALYSHDTLGLGHVRRNLLLTQALAEADLNLGILLISGTRQAGEFDLPPGVDTLILPSLSKRPDGRYCSRSLHVNLSDLVVLRAKTLCAALEAFNPDVLIVDNVPRGAVHELDPTLEYLHVRGNTRLVFGMREVLDEPTAVEREWRHAANEETLRRYYDAIWVYGDPTVYDAGQAYCFAPDILEKVRYTGYLDQRVRLDTLPPADEEILDELLTLPGRLALCLVGGGQDGALLAEAFAQAVFPEATTGVILTGPFMPRQVRGWLQQLAAERPHLRVIEFIKEPAPLLAQADVVISMGGYNTTCEILSFEKRALIVPRISPRQEQLVRARRLQELGLVEMLHPDDLSPATLSAWLARDQGPTPSIRAHVDLDGLRRIPHLLAEVLQPSNALEWEPTPCRRMNYAG